MFLIKNIKHLRESRNLTQKDIAEAIDKSPQVFSQYEKGKVSPPLEVIEKIASYFGIQLKDLMFTDLQNIQVNRVEEPRAQYNRVTRLLEKELDRLEALEKEIKETPGALEALRKIAPELVKKIENE